MVMKVSNFIKKITNIIMHRVRKGGENKEVEIPPDINNADR